MQTVPLTRELEVEARRLGFDLVGACPAVTPAGISCFYDWLDAGFAGEMQYLARRRAAYEHPRHVLDGARSILMLAMNYQNSGPAAARSGQGKVSRYAWGADYHDALHERLKELGDFLRDRAPGAAVRGVVDTAPLLEREFAVLAGLGWIGKNTMLLNRRQGSWFFLAALLTDVELDYNEHVESDHCGTCRACLDACPTDAFVEPYVLDSRRCISYLTIELKTQIPAELRPPTGEWLFGCDICQEVCPWNHRVEPSGETAFRPDERLYPADLLALFDLDDEAFRRMFRTSPLWRPKRRGILRNAAIVLGNWRDPAGVPASEKGLTDVEPLVRGASAWALGQIDTAETRRILTARLTVENDNDVRREIEAALVSQASGPRPQASGHS